MFKISKLRLNYRIHNADAGTIFMRFDYYNWTVPDNVRTESNRRKTRALFQETASPRTIKQYPPVYTLKEEDHYNSYFDTWFPSAKQIYLASVDEYSAARKLVGSIQHWNRLIKLDWFLTGEGIDSFYGLEQWREEMEDAQRSRALEMLYDQAAKGNVAAIKALMEGQKPKKRGRPSKEEVAGERKKEARKSTELSADAERLSKVIELSRGKK